MMKEKDQTKHEKHLVRLARIEGQVRGIQRMIREGDYCIDIITQIQAVQSALGAVNRSVLQKHMDTCVMKAIRSRSRKDTDEKLNELMRMLKRMCR